MRGALREQGVVLLKADWTRRDDRITEALASLRPAGRAALRALRPRDGERPALLPEVLTPGIVLNALDENLGDPPPPTPWGAEPRA